MVVMHYHLGAEVWKREEQYDHCPTNCCKMPEGPVTFSGLA